MARARWDRARGPDPEVVQELAAHPPVMRGDPIAVLEYRDLRSGEIRRWTVLMGDRRDQVRLRHKDGRTSKSMGWTRVLEVLRGYLAGTKS